MSFSIPSKSHKYGNDLLFKICTHAQISLGRSCQDQRSGQSMWNAWESREKCTRFWWQSPEERDHSEDQGVNVRMGSEWILGRVAGIVDWIRLAQDMDRWRTADESSSSCSKELVSQSVTELVSLLVSFVS
jgi:hypothetical protein